MHIYIYYNIQIIYIYAYIHQPKYKCGDPTSYIYIYIAVCSKRHEILGVGPHEVEIHRGVPWHPLIWRSIAWMTEIYGQDILILWPHFLWI